MNPLNLILVVLLVISANVSGLWLSTILNTNKHQVIFLPRFADISKVLDLIFDAQEKTKKRKYTILLSTYLLSPVLGAIAFFSGFEPFEDYPCRQYKIFLEYSLKGTLKEKYVDTKNHSFRTLKLLNGEEEQLDREIDFYIPEVYNQVGKGDTIVKKAKTNYVVVKNGGKERRFVSFSNRCIE